MSFNQSRADRSDSSQQRRGGRSGNYPRSNTFSASSGKGGGAAAPPPNLQQTRSFSKKNNAPGGQYRATGYGVNSNSDLNSASTNPAAPNGSHIQPPVPAPNATFTGSIVKSTPEQPAQRSAAQVVANAPSQAANVKPAPAPQATPTKAPVDASKSIAIQFGSVSPGTLNGMQIPARTSSAPPNLVEQQRDQARRDAQRQAPPIPIPSVPKQQMPRKDGGPSDLPKTGEPHQIPMARRDIQVQSHVPASQTQKAHIHNISGVSMPMPFHHHVPVQFGGPTPQMQPQGIAGTSLTMPMQLPMGSAPQLPHSIYVSGLHPHPHPHPMQSQGIMHQGQGLNFPPPMGQQMPSQLGNLGMGPGSQFSQIQAQKFTSSRKPVKITHPDTHEELRLGNTAGPKSHQIVPQSQPGASVPTSHPMNYYPNPAFLSTQGPAALNSAANPSSQPLPRVVSQGSQTASAPVQVTIKPATGVHVEKVNYLASSTISVEKSKSHKPEESSSIHPKVSEIHQNSSSNQAKPVDSVVSPAVEEPAPVVSIGTINRTSQGIFQPSSQVPGQSTSVSSLPSHSIEHTDSFSSKTSETPDAKPTGPFITDSVVESVREPLPTVKATSNVLVSKPESTKASVAKAADSLDTESCGERSIVSSHGEPSLDSKAAKHDNSNSKLPTESVSAKVSGVVNQTEINSSEPTRTSSQEVKSLEVAEKGMDNPSNNSKEDKIDVSSALPVPCVDNAKSAVTSTPKTSFGNNESLDGRPAVVSDDGVAPGFNISPPESTLKSEESVKEKSVAELSRSKSSMARGKKKRKELLQKADAAGNTSDLYMAYKGPEEKKEIAASESNYTKDVLGDSIENVVDSSEKSEQGKAEPDDWEDATDISTPKLEATDSSKASKGHKHLDSDEMAKKYTRDFLLKFCEQCTDLPEGFEITSDVADALMVPNVNAREPYPSPGRVIDRSPGGPRRGPVVGDEDRWNRMPVPLMPGRDLRMDGHGGNFRPGQGGNHGVLRNVRGPVSSQYAGGILSGPVQSMGSHMGVQRSNSDADRWQRATGFQKGLIPSPHTPAPAMHKAERKYQIGKITDEEEAKQRQLKAILNKLTPQNFERLFEQVKEVNIDNAGTLTGVISQIFDKALMEPTFCEMYANFCFYLAGELPDFSDEDNEKITFKRLLLNKCQEEFERDEREKEEADRDDAESEVKQSPAEKEEKRVQARRRMLGNIRLIGELYKKKMLTERIMHECIKKLLGEYQNPDEEDIEALCKLMSTIGEMIDHPRAKEHMDAYFAMMSRLSNNMKLSSRVRFMLKDAIDLRKNKWQQRRKVEGPKKIEDVHRDAAQEKQVQAGRLARGPGPNTSARNRQPMDFSSRGSNVLSTPNTQMGGYRGPQSQPRFGVQDARIDDRHSFESRGPSVPLPQRPLGEESITLGPQGGLARGMSSRGQLSIGNAPLAGLNGYGSVPDRSAYGSREELMPRSNMPQRFGGPYDQGPILDRNASFGNRDMRNADRTSNKSRPSSPNVGSGGLAPTHNVSSEKVWPEERLREMSLSTIKEFYSARDEKEVALCVKDLNAPGFYATMISIWISDSFERKDMERDSLAKLLTNLSKSQDSLLNHDHLLKGFEMVLSTLEDAVNDAPKAGEFLGRIFAKIIVEDVIPFSEIGQLVYEGGEEQGSLVEGGLAAEIVGTVLETVKSEKGESVLNDIRASSGSKLERFRPPNTKRPLRLDKFI